MTATRSKYPRIPDIRIYDLRNVRFGRLIAIAPCCKLGVKRTTTYWNCLCDCDRYHVAGADDLIKEKTQSCGCLHVEIITSFQFAPIHNGTGTRLHCIWKNMKRRCYNPKHRAYRYYGGKGIGICSEWVNDFNQFRNWALNNGYAENLTIERNDTSKSYTPENCCWISRAENGGRSRRGIKKECNPTTASSFAVTPKFVEQLGLVGVKDGSGRSKQRRSSKKKHWFDTSHEQLDLFGQSKEVVNAKSHR